MNAGFYKRRRGILEHIESGEIDLLENGIHDYLSLKANLVIGSPCSIPVGVCFTSAPALHAHCRRVSERTMQRILEHIEAIGWLRTFKTPGKRGNYPTLLCRASVHDLSGNEYRVNGAKTIDWTKPVYEPVGEVSPEELNPVPNESGNRKLRNEKRDQRRQQKKPASASAVVEISHATLQAFKALGYEQPFGAPEFQSIWTDEYSQVQTNNPCWTDIMERAILRCQAADVKVPSLFFAHKREIEKGEVR